MSIKQALAKANKNLSCYWIKILFGDDDQLPYTVIVYDAGGILDTEGCEDEQDVIATVKRLGQLYREYEEKP